MKISRLALIIVLGAGLSALTMAQGHDGHGSDHSSHSSGFDGHSSSGHASFGGSSHSSSGHSFFGGSSGHSNSGHSFYGGSSGHSGFGGYSGSSHSGYGWGSSRSGYGSSGYSHSGYGHSGFGYSSGHSGNGYISGHYGNGGFNRFGNSNHYSDPFSSGYATQHGHSGSGQSGHGWGHSSGHGSGHGGFGSSYGHGGVNRGGFGDHSGNFDRGRGGGNVRIGHDHGDGWRHGFHHYGDFGGTSFFFGFYLTDPYEPCVVSPWYYYPCLPAYLPYDRVVVVNDYCPWNAGAWYSFRPGYNPNDYGDSDLNYSLDQLQNVFNHADESALDDVVSPDAQVAIYGDGKYMYSLNGQDFHQMMLDNMHGVQNVNFQITGVRRDGDQAIVYARHEFVNPDGGNDVVYQAYRLRREGDTYIVVDFDSSEHPLEGSHLDHF